MTVNLSGFADEILPDLRAKLAALAESISHLELCSAWSVNHILASGLVTPALTTVAAPLRMMGAAAVTNLIALIGGARSRSDQPTVLPVKLMVRASTPHSGNTIALSLGAGKVPWAGRCPMIRVSQPDAVDPLVLAVDIGSAVTRGDVYDAAGRPVAGGRCKVPHQFATAADGTSQIDPDAVVEEVAQAIGQLAGRWRAGASPRSRSAPSPRLWSGSDPTAARRPRATPTPTPAAPSSPCCCAVRRPLRKQTTWRGGTSSICTWSVYQPRRAGYSFVGGAGDDQGGWNYTERFKRIFMEEGITQVSCWPR
jgi:hypothetical protein